jgi:hypothetical protein
MHHLLLAYASVERPNEVVGIRATDLLAQAGFAPAFGSFWAMGLGALHRG